MFIILYTIKSFRSEAWSCLEIYQYKVEVSSHIAVQFFVPNITSFFIIMSPRYFVIQIQARFQEKLSFVNADEFIKTTFEKRN